MSRNGRQPPKSKSPKPRLETPTRSMSKEEFLQWAFSRLDEKLSSAARQNLQANYELQYDYPDEYVVYLDDWTGEGKNRRLNRRVLGHGPMEETPRLSALVDSLPPEDRLRVQYHYVSDPFLDELWV
jgi:hypothetical protein